MAQEEIIVLNPNDNNHKKMYLEFIKLNNLKEEIIKDIPQEANEIDMYLFTKRGKAIQDLCHLSGVRDIKICSITYPRIKSKRHRIKIIDLAAQYAIDILRMEEVFIKLTSDDTLTINALNGAGYECLGVEKDVTLFLKERVTY